MSNMQLELPALNPNSTNSSNERVNEVYFTGRSGSTVVRAGNGGRSPPTPSLSFRAGVPHAGGRKGEQTGVWATVGSVNVGGSVSNNETGNSTLVHGSASGVGVSRVAKKHGTISAPALLLACSLSLCLPAETPRINSPKKLTNEQRQRHRVNER